MAIAGWQGASTFTNGACIHRDEVIKLICNLDALDSDSLFTKQQVSCIPVDGEFTVSQDNGESCLIIESQFRDVNPLSEDGQAIDKKALFLRFSGEITYESGGISQGEQVTLNDGVQQVNTSGVNQITQNVGVVVSCGRDDQFTELQSASITDFNSGALFPFFCNRRDDIRICISGDFDVTVCGGLLCVASYSLTSDRQTGLYCMPKPDNCCIDRTALYLAEQNTADICARYLNSCDQTVECFDTTISGTGNTPIATAPADGIFVSLGALQFCTSLTNVGGDENKPDEFIHANANIGCAGSSSVNCGATFVVKGDVSGISYGEQCFWMPVFSCGSCKEGDLLAFNNDVDLECPSEPTPFITKPVQVEGDVCTWYFGKAATDALPAFSGINLPPCPDGDALQLMADKVVALHDFACEREDVNFSCDTGRATTTGTAVIVPPSNPPPPIPNRKKFVSANVAFSIAGNGGGETETAKGVTGTFTLECGGEVKTYPVQWVYQTSGQVFLQGASTYIAGCFTCPVTVPVIATITTNNGPTITATIDYQCISF